jgi:hypothetical protein
MWGVPGGIQSFISPATAIPGLSGPRLTLHENRTGEIWQRHAERIRIVLVDGVQQSIAQDPFPRLS